MTVDGHRMTYPDSFSATGQVGFEISRTGVRRRISAPCLDEIINVILPALPPTDSEQVRRDRSRTQLHVISRATPDIPGIRQQIMDLKRALSIKAQLRQGQIDPAG